MRSAFSRRALTSLRAAATQASRPASLSQQWRATRQYSIKPHAASTAQIQDLDPSKLTIEKTSKPKALKKPEELVFGRNFTG